MSEHTHDDDRLTIGCPACIEGARVSAQKPDMTLSAGRRRTIRDRALLDSGIHPATRRKLLAEPGHTCGDCVHHHHYGWHNSSYHKCDQHRLGESHSEASDIRVGWPACVLWEPA